MTQFIVAIIMILFGVSAPEAAQKQANGECLECYDQAKQSYYESLINAKKDGGGMDNLGAS